MKDTKEKMALGVSNLTAVFTLGLAIRPFV